MNSRSIRPMVCCLILVTAFTRPCLAAGILAQDGTDEISDWRDFRLTGRVIWFRATHPTLKEGLGYAGLTLAALYLERNKFDLAGETRDDRSHASDALAARFRPLGEAIVPLAALTT